MKLASAAQLTILYLNLTEADPVLLKAEAG